MFAIARTIIIPSPTKLDEINKRFVSPTIYPTLDDAVQALVTIWEGVTDGKGPLDEVTSHDTLVSLSQFNPYHAPIRIQRWEIIELTKPVVK